MKALGAAIKAVESAQDTTEPKLLLAQDVVCACAIPTLVKWKMLLLSYGLEGEMPFC